MFSALPGGGRYNDGSFFNIRNKAFFWSSTESYFGLAWNLNLNNDNSNVNRWGYDYYKPFGASVRCLRD